MNADEEAPQNPLSPDELDHLRAMDPRSRAEWMLEDCARHEGAWGLVDAQGWVVFSLNSAPDGRRPWALPLWPRLELAALSARDQGEQPRYIELSPLLEELLPDVETRLWQVLACPDRGDGFVEGASAFAARLAEAWEEWDDEGG